MSAVAARDNEALVAGMTLLLFVCALALLLGFGQRPEFAFMADPRAHQLIDPATDPKGHAQQARLKQISQRFEEAVAMLHAKKYDFAVTALHKVLELSPNLVDAHVNMGYALLGLKNYKAAGDFFANAIRLDAYKANAYWGLGLALEQLGDKEAALGAMRSYIHLAPPGDPYVRKARSALWEWEEELKRGPTPKQEAQWIEQRGKEWEDRNSPDVDKPAATAPGVDLLKGR